MQTFSHIVDFNQYKIGEQFREFLTPGSANPGAVVQDDEGKGLYWTGTTWLSYIRAWADLAATGGTVTVRQKFHLTRADALNVLTLMTYNTHVWGSVAAFVRNGVLTVTAHDTLWDQQRFPNPLAVVEVGPVSQVDHEWVVSISRTHITVDLDGKNIINVDIPTSMQGTMIDSLRVRCPLCVLTAHEVTCQE